LKFQTHSKTEPVHAFNGHKRLFSKMKIFFASFAFKFVAVAQFAFVYHGWHTRTRWRHYSRELHIGCGLFITLCRQPESTFIVSAVQISVEKLHILKLSVIFFSSF